jgi:ketosteroid isomerase-like protein
LPRDDHLERRVEGGKAGGIGVAELGDVAGRDGYLATMRTITEDFEDAVTENETIDAGDDGVVVITSGHLTGKRSGVRLEDRRGYIYRLEAGGIVRVTFFMEPDHALQAAGLGG